MFADFAARGRSGLKSRELNWTAPVKLAAVQSSPWLHSGSYLPKPNQTRKTHPDNKPTNRQTKRPKARGEGDTTTKREKSDMAAPEGDPKQIQQARQWP